MQEWKSAGRKSGTVRLSTLSRSVMRYREGRTATSGISLLNGFLLFLAPLPRSSRESLQAALCVNERSQRGQPTDLIRDEVCSLNGNLKQAVRRKLASPLRSDQRTNRTAARLPKKRYRRLLAGELIAKTHRRSNADFHSTNKPSPARFQAAKEPSVGKRPLHDGSKKCDGDGDEIIVKRMNTPLFLKGVFCSGSGSEINIKAMKYSDYLKSEHWKQTKELKSKSAARRCGICGDSKKVELHHLFYRPELTDVELSDTRWLCRDCHQTTHDLIKLGVLKFPKPNNHHSCFALTKHAVKKALGFGNKNLFYAISWLPGRYKHERFTLG